MDDAGGTEMGRSARLVYSPRCVSVENAYSKVVRGKPHTVIAQVFVDRADSSRLASLTQASVFSDLPACNDSLQCLNAVAALDELSISQ